MKEFIDNVKGLLKEITENKTNSVMIKALIEEFQDDNVEELEHGKQNI